jgi:hypothetical protein
LVAYPAFVYGQAKPAPHFFVVCASQVNEPTVYLSGVLEGPATAFANFRTGFSEFLTQRYAYKGAVVCGPTNTAANAQKFIETRSAALRNAKKNVVDTGWSQSSGALASVATTLNGVQSPKPQVKAAASAAPAVAPTAAPAAAPAAAPSNGNAAGSSQIAGVLSTLFGTSGGSSNDAGGASTAKPGQAKSAAGAGGTTGSGASGDGSSGGQSPIQQVSAALTSAFAAKSASASVSTDSSPKDSQPTVAESGLGSAQAQNTKLVVYGCGRQDRQIACVTELANQNQKETLVKASEVWKDAFIVDDRGDRHLRTSGFFLNVDGDQRPQLDISYGKSARFILMFDGVQTKVQKVALRSPVGGLDIEEINLIGANAGMPSSQQH